MGNQTLLMSLLGAGALLSACNASYQVGEIAQQVGCLTDNDCSVEKVCDSGMQVCVRPAPTDKLDVLFVIDNSTSMSLMQATLANNIPKFIQRIEATSANYHIGVVTTDVGTLPPPGTPFPGASDTRCNTLNGDDGRLQNKSCRDRTQNVSPNFMTSCNKLCPTSIVPTDPWLSRDGGTYNVSDPIAAFQCMALVGDGGCGVEGQFESVKRALDGHLAENSGFLREDSLLAIIFITDEDDCSIKASSRVDANPAAVKCTVPDKDPAASCFNLDYRCMARDLECDQSMDTAGTKTNCKERASSWLEDVTGYVNSLKGLRKSNRLFVSGFWNVPSIASGGSFEVASDSVPDNSTYLLNRVRRNCGFSDGFPWGAMPQIRLSKYAQSFKTHKEADLCLIDSYGLALDNMAATILLQAGLTPGS